MGSAPIIEFGCVARHPAKHCRMIHVESALQHQFIDVTVAQRITQIPPYPTQNDLWFEKIAVLAMTGGRAGTCVTLALKIVPGGYADGLLLFRKAPHRSRDLSNSTQWVNVPFGASGSSMMRMKECVSGGTWLQSCSGEVSWPSHIRVARIGPVCRKEGHVGVNLISAMS
jgi:hypothetical protein